MYCKISFNCNVLFTQYLSTLTLPYCAILGGIDFVFFINGSGDGTDCVDKLKSAFHADLKKIFFFISIFEAAKEGGL